ncbi:MAG TPA: septum formation initiator family protein [Acidimicrobiales bacterium]|jgi:cell division protein FtsB|nr:septum formation initiator family protein [Acidimicrobiales bacterium]
MARRPPARRRGEGGATAWLVLAVLALVGVLFLAGLPARAYVAQRRERAEVAARVRQLAAENRDLTAREARLQTDAEIERLARQHYNLVRPGEEVFAIIPAPPPPATPPASPVSRARPGWWQRVFGSLTGLD